MEADIWIDKTKLETDMEIYPGYQHAELNLKLINVDILSKTPLEIILTFQDQFKNTIVITLNKNQLKQIAKQIIDIL